jgi:hypothetical protein
MTKRLSWPYRQNTSLLKHSSEYEDEEPTLHVSVDILNRNKCLALIHEMLGVGRLTSTVTPGARKNKSTTSRIIPRSLWPRLLTKVGGLQHGQRRW